jgi:ABC-type multidrug transport system permease subunit
MIILFTLIVIGVVIPWIFPDPLWRILCALVIILYLTTVVLIVLHRRTGTLSSIEKYISLTL